jgi:stage V sporulation protein G
MKISRMHPFQSDSKTSAFFDVETEEGIIIKGFSLVQGSKGLFMSVPSDKGKDDKYYEKILIPDGMKKELNDMAVKKYQAVTAEDF